LGGKNVVEDLSLSVKKGEIFGLLGPNGAGKTTTIRMIVGLMKITKGNVFVNNMNMKDNFSEAMSEMGAIVENPEMYKFLTGYQNLIHFARMAKTKVTKERIDDIVRIVDLQDAINKKVKTYSLGMRQRLGVAQALLHQPSLLILDEPTNGLDPKGIQEFRHYLRNLTKDGISVIVSSHLLSEMQLICDRVAILQHGELISVDTIEEVDGKGDTDNMLVQFDVENPDEALEVIQTFFPNFECGISGESLEISIPKEQIPSVNEKLSASDISVYGIHTRKKTLEDKFLEMTKEVE
ncbi:MAG TPA: ABC transporter ATP-binding protein, partial [Bacillota bacterium]|nr:ABC transporter ATP-binding protein [Bacillota bacterium]